MTQPPSDFQTARSMSQTEADDSFDIAAFVRPLWRGKWIILLCMVIMVALGGYYAYRVAVPIYTANSVVMLETANSAETVTDIQSVVAGLASDSVAINSEIAVVQSRELLGKVVDKEHLLEDPEFNPSLRKPDAMARFIAQVKQRIFFWQTKAVPTTQDKATQLKAQRDTAITILLGALNVSIVSNTKVIQIAVTTPSAPKSTKLADAVAKAYVQDQITTKVQATEQASGWLGDRVEELQKQLETSETKLSTFTSGTSLISEDALNLLERQLKDLRERISSTQQSITQAKAKLSEMEAAKTPQDKAAAADDTQLNQLLSGASSGVGRTAFETQFETLQQRLRADIARQTAQVTSLSSSRDSLASQIKQQSQDLITQQQLSREVQANTLLYQYFLGRLKETSAQQGIQQADSRILSQAVIPSIPTAPHKSMILVMSLLVGALIGAAIVILREMRQNTFRTAGELERHTGVTVMGQIPLLPNRNRKGALQYLVEKPTSAAAEAIRNLRTSILLSNIDRTPQVIMSTSALPGEGKSTVSIALAQNFVGMGKKVLLIEGDIRRRVFSQYTGHPTDQNLMQVLSGEKTLEEAVSPEEVIGCDVLLSGQSTVNGTDIFASQSFANVLARAREIYDIVVIDTPPVLVVPDARVIAQLADAVLFVVRWDSTLRSQVSDGLKMLEVGNTRVAGLALNQISPQGMKRYGYGDSYGAYAAYGQRYYTE